MDKSQRTEINSLGEVPLPTDAMSRAQTQPGVNNFLTSGLYPWRVFIWSMETNKRARVERNRDPDLLDTSRAEAISQAAQEVIEGKWDDHFRVDLYQAGAGSSHDMNLNKGIANRATALLRGNGGNIGFIPMTRST